MKFAAGIEYQGGAYNGWQRQKQGRSLQAEVERALSRVADHSVQVVCAGRTDAGVHAVGQVVHFETEATREERAWALGANANLPPDIAITWVRAVPDDFHARFRAQWRQYRYVILNRGMRPGLLRGKVTWRPRPLDAQCMREAASMLLGTHDFSSFRALACQAKHPRRTVLAIDLQQEGDCIHLDIRADGFLHHMVRNIAGSLMMIGEGEREPGWMGELLESRDRTLAGMTAPPDGLYFVHARYEAGYGLPDLIGLPRFS